MTTAQVHVQQASLAWAPKNTTVKPNTLSWAIKELQTVTLPSGCVLHPHDYQKIPLSQRNRYLEALNQVLQKPELTNLFKDRGVQPLKFHFSEKGLTVELNGERILLSSLLELVTKDNEYYKLFKQLSEMQNYAEAMHLGRRTSTASFTDPRLEGLYRTTMEKAVQRNKQDASENGCLYATKEYAAETANVGGIVRNAISASSKGLAESTAASLLGLAGGFLALASGGFICKIGKNTLDASHKVGLQEGVHQGRMEVGLGVTLIGVGLGMSVSKAASLGPVSHMAHAAQIANYSMLAAIPVYGIFSLFTLAYGGYGYYKTNGFRNKCAEYLENPEITDPLKKYQGFARFLKDELYLNSLDIMKLKAKVGTNGSSQEQDAKFLQEAEKLLAKKRLRFEKRTSPELASKIASTIDGVLKNFDDPVQRNNAVKDAAAMAFDVKKASFKKLVYYALLLIAGLIGLAAAIASLVVTGGLPFILMAVAAGLWIFIDHSKATSFASEFFWLLLHRNEKPYDPTYT